MSKLAIVRAKSDDVTEIMVYDVIGADFWGDGITAKDFREQVKAVKTKNINLRLNSPGGSVTEGAAMLNALDQFKGRIDVDVDGMAASAASVLMMAGDTVRVASNGLVMIHNPWAGVLGTADDMRRTADLLDKVRDQILDSYLRKSSLTREELGAMMDAETWMTGQEAVDAGFADEVSGPVTVAACAIPDGFQFKNLPKDKLDAMKPTGPTPEQKAAHAARRARLAALAR